MSKARKPWHRKQRGIDITRLMSRDGDKCWLCGEPVDRYRRRDDDPKRVSFDHIVPRSDGGNSKLPNLRLAHADCNSARGNDPLIESADE